MKGRLAFVQANNHCMEPTGFMWSYLKMLKPADSFAVPGSSSTKAESWNAGISTAYELGAEWFFLMDVDQLFPKMTIPHLFETAEKYNAKIVCGLHHLKRAPWAPIAGWEKIEDGKTMVAINVNGNLWKSEFTELNQKNPENPVVEVDWAGSGAMLIHREVIEAIGWPPFKDVMNDKRGTRDTGHDVNFCIRAREKGYKTYVDTRVDCPHGGFYYFDKAFGKAAKETGFIERFGGIVQEQTREKEYWDTVWGEEFLKNASREAHYKETLDNITEIVPCGKVADIGSGPGVFLEYLKDKKGIVGTGYDFSEKAIEILKNKGFEGKVADFRTYSPNGDKSSYDSVISLHTIEHIKDDNGFIDLMKSLCKPGGKVVIATPWREEIQNCFEHVHQYSDEDMDALMKSHFTSYEVRKNNRDYVAVGVNS